MTRTLVTLMTAVTATTTVPQRVVAATSIFAPQHAPDRPRSDILVPAVSFLLPGFDQWWEGQYGSAAAYTGVALGGMAYAGAVAKANGLDSTGQKAKDDDAADGDDAAEDESLVDQKDVATRKVVLGSLVYQGAGGLSAYHSFRTAVRTRKGGGEYEFLTYEETPGDLLLAPFRFGYLTRPSTIVPLGIGAVLMALVMNSEPGEDTERDKFTGADAFFTGAFSYNAGTHEEAMFRGWLYPVMYDAWGSPFWSNAAQSVLFAAAHLNTNPQPLPQLLLGYHLGNVTARDGWRLGEAIFIHVWWDVLAFTTAYHYKQKQPEPAGKAPLASSGTSPTLWLPPLYFHF